MTNSWYDGRMTAIVVNILPDRRNHMMKRVVVEMGTDRMCELRYRLDEKYVLLFIFSARLYLIPFYLFLQNFRCGFHIFV